MEKQSLLFFGNNLKILKSKINRLKKQYIVYCVSQDIEIYIDEELKKEGGVVILPYNLEHITFSDDAFKMVEAINNSFKNIKTLKPRYLYELNYLCEGGVTGEYADYLYAIAFFNKIMLDYKIDVVYSERICNSRIIDALEDVAKSNKLQFHFVKAVDFSLPKIKDRFYFSKIPIFSLLISLETQLKCILRIARSAKKNAKDLEKESYDIGFILVSNLNKHINWLLDDIKEIEEKFKYCVFCYHADIAKEKLISLGKKAKSVEGYFNFRTALRDYIYYLWDSFVILKSIKKMDSLWFQNVDVTKTISHLYVNYLFREKLDDIMHEEIVYRFLQKNQPKLLTGNGDTNFISNKIFYFTSQKLKLDVVFYKNCVFFEAYNVEKCPCVYEPYSYIINLRFFMNGSTVLKMLRKQGWKGQYYYLPDSKNADKYYNSVFSNQKNLLTEETIVLWAPSYPAQGLYSISSFIQDNNIILQSIQNFDYKLVVKYHPHQEEKQICNIVKRYKNNKRIELVDQYSSIEKYIEYADIVITTLSTVLFDAAVKKKLVICLVDDLGMELSEHLKDYFYLVRRDDINWEEILFDWNFRSNQIAKQNAFLEDKFYNPENKYIGDILQAYIKNDFERLK